MVPVEISQTSHRLLFSFSVPPIPQLLQLIRNQPFLVTMHYAFQTPYKLHLVLDYIGGGELYRHLELAGPLPVDRLRFYLAEIVLAVEYLHTHNMVYRDLKLENVMLDADGHIVLTDFGLCKQVNDEGRAYSFSGTAEYMSPELMRSDRRDGYTVAVDWWSVGVIAYELVTGTLPFDDTPAARKPTNAPTARTTKKTKKTKKTNKPPVDEIMQNVLHVEPLWPSTLEPTTRDLLKQLLTKDPRQRLNKSRRTADDIKEHPFFASIDWTELAAKGQFGPFRPTIVDPLDTSNFDAKYTCLATAERRPTCAPHPDEHFAGYSFVAANHPTAETKPKPANRYELVQSMPTVSPRTHFATLRKRFAIPFALCRSNLYSQISLTYAI